MSKPESGAPIPSRRMLWTITALAGIVVVVLIVWLAQLAPANTCGSDPSGQQPLTAFQSAKSVDDISAVFGIQASTCRAALVTSMDRLNRADLFMYIPAAGILLAGFLLASRRPGRMWAFWIGAAAILLTVAGDLIETSTQLVITSAIAQTPATSAGVTDNLIQSLVAGNTLKIYGLPTAFAALAAISWGRGAWANVLSGILIICSASRFAAGLTPDIPALPLIGGLFGVATLAVAAAIMAARRWLAPTPPN